MRRVEVTMVDSQEDLENLAEGSVVFMSDGDINFDHFLLRSKTDTSYIFTNEENPGQKMVARRLIPYSEISSVCGELMTDHSLEEYKEEIKPNHPDYRVEQSMLDRKGLWIGVASE